MIASPVLQPHVVTHRPVSIIPVTIQSWPAPRSPHVESKLHGNERGLELEIEQVERISST